MAKITYQFPVADVCGKLDKKSNLVFAHLGDTKYSRMIVPRTKPFTAEEKARQEKFARTTVATRARLQDPTQSVADQKAFAEQSKYKTLYQYVFNQEYNKD